MNSPDWSSLIEKLIETKKYTEQSIADYVGTSQATINYLKSGRIAEPRYHIGVLLVSLCTVNGISIKNKKTSVGQN